MKKVLLMIFEYPKGKSYCGGRSFCEKFEYLIRRPMLRERLGRKAHRIARDFLAHNRFKRNFAGLLIAN